MVVHLVGQMVYEMDEYSVDLKVLYLVGRLVVLMAYEKDFQMASLTAVQKVVLKVDQKAGKSADLMV